jgi:hypothetical protein
MLMQMMMMPFQLPVVNDDIDDEKNYDMLMPDVVDVVALSLS